jgi:hypothetical protein
MCRESGLDPDLFGIFDMKGLYFVAGDLIRDFLALNKIEILPWDDWGYISAPPIPEEDLPILDQIADLTVGGDNSHKTILELFEKDHRLHPNPNWQP